MMAPPASALGPAGRTAQGSDPGRVPL